MDYFPYVWGFVFWLRQHRLYPLCLSVSVFVRVFAWLYCFPTRMNTSNVCLRVYGFKKKRSEPIPFPRPTLAAASSSSSSRVLRGVASGSDMTRTEFWGREVKPGQTVSCDAGDEYVIRISQVALGDTNKKKEEVAIYVKVDHWQIVTGTLMAKRHPHMMCDLTFEKEFELSHSSQTSSVFFCGYKNYPFKSDGAKGKHKGKAPAKLDAKMDKSWDDDLPSSGDMDTYEDSTSSTDNLTIPSYSDEDIPEDVSFTDQDVSLSQTHELETSEKVTRWLVMWQHLTNDRSPARCLQIASRRIANPQATFSASHATGHLSMTWHSSLTGKQNIQPLSDLVVGYQDDMGRCCSISPNFFDIIK
ncbi:uncharacterized protein LOC125544584 isoform X2 [Triticum urartu]|uniref:uncharacterized protein LOC125544584 isoform X2 n=1 Tax=Triticum urartu TaxID=4572 RepID=UPI002043A6A6|nr:uncharacterized protein LOC125544584 isoform X2 [Triticum urartu]